VSQSAAAGAVTGSERVFFIFLELTAACLFGTLLGELQVASEAVL
jgi:hypothetical protein